LNTRALLLRKDFIELRMSLETKLPQSLHNILPLDAIDLDIFLDNSLDEADLVQESLVLFLKLGKHVILPPFIELLPQDKEFLKDVLFALISFNLALVVEKDIVVGRNTRAELELLVDCFIALVNQFLQLRDLEDKVDSILLVIFTDLFNFILGSELFKIVLVVTGPLADR